MNGLYYYKIFNHCDACVQTVDNYQDYDTCRFDAVYALNIWYNVTGKAHTMEIYSMRTGKPRRVKRIRKTFTW